ncbi:unnamed protein product, partial [Symbiodinium necroappetens]
MRILFCCWTWQDTNQKLVELAVERLAGAQKEVGSAREAVKFAERHWQIAIEGNDKEQVSMWKQEVNEAEQKVEKAKQEVEKAKQEVEKAEQKVEEAKQEVKEAKQEVKEVTAEDFDIAKCSRPQFKVKPSNFVQLAPCVKACIDAVARNLNQQTDATTVRVPPTVLSRCMRGGKTTVLLHVFDELKCESKNPIFISFNGDSLIRQLENESCLEAMLRAIAMALMKEKPKNHREAARIRCRPHVLEEYLKDKNDVVLIVDELNVLLKPSESDGYAAVGAFLREQFLDPAGRCLIFSTHVPTSLGLSHLLGEGSGSSRTAEIVEMPRSDDMQKLRGMHEQCEALTPCEAVYYGRIPSLMYSVKTQCNSFNMLSRFQAIASAQPTEALTKCFLSEFFTGERGADSAPIRAFDSLTESPASGQIRWILAYVGKMCSHLGLSGIAAWVEEIPRLSGKVESGLDWEAIVLVALSLRCVQAKYGYVHPLLNLPELDEVKGVFLKNVPQDWCKTLPDMVKWWKQRTVSPDAFPYIAVLSPNYAKTEVVDAAWIYQQNSASNYVVRGLQDKLGGRTAVPSADMPDGMLGLLMRGKAPSTGKQAKGWVYPSSRDIRDFLGASLSALYPSDWWRELRLGKGGRNNFVTSAPGSWCPVSSRLLPLLVLSGIVCYKLEYPRAARAELRWRLSLFAWE